MNLQQLNVLVEVADTRSLTRAAQRLGLTQSGASQAVAALEAELGVPVLVRERRGVALTAVGNTVVMHARDILSNLDAIRQAGEAARELPRQRLRLASFPTVFERLLPPILKQFRTLHPRIDVIALEAADEEVESWLEADAVDLGVVLNPPAGRCSALLGHDQWVVLVPARHRLAVRQSGQVTLSELVKEPFVVATGGCVVHARSLARDAGLELADIRVELRDWASAFALVREGVGITIVPELTLPENQRGLRALRLDPPIHRTFGLQVAGKSVGTPAVEAFLDVLTKSEQEEPCSTEIAGPLGISHASKYRVLSRDS